MQTLTAHPFRTASVLSLALCSTFASLAFGGIDNRFTEVVQDPDQLHIQFRFSDGEELQSAEGFEDQTKIADGTFAPYEIDPDNPPAYAFVIDVTNPARANTIRICAETAQKMIDSLPDKADVGIFSLGFDITALAPIGSPKAEIRKVLSEVTAEAGDQSQRTFIYRNCADLVEKTLGTYKSDRRALVLFTDGLDEEGDETVGSANIDQLDPIKKASIERLINSANNHDVTIFALGYPDSVDDEATIPLQVLEQVAEGTSGKYVGAESSTKQLKDPQFVESFPTLLTAGGTVTFAGNDLAGASEFYAKVLTTGNQQFQIPEAAFAISYQAAATPNPPANPTPPATTDPATDETEPKPEEDPAKTAEGSAETEGGEGDESDLMTTILIAAISFIILLILILLLRSRKRAREEEEARQAAERAQIEQGLEEHPVLSSEPERVLAVLQLLDAEQTQLPISTTSAKIGRGKSDDVRIPNDSVSRSHCVIKRTPDGAWMISDLDSGNGVILNDRQVEQSVVQPGDIIELGEVKMRFTLPE